ncbi:MAG: PA14 domain-containing protein, partial [Bacteroidota bacterium]
YSWDFGDGSPLSTAPNPTHLFTSATTGPTNFTVRLTVTDNENLSAQQTLRISLNNTPPNIVSTSIDNIQTFSPTDGLVLNLSAVVNDNEHDAASLTYNWITELHHNDHFHPELGDPNPVTTTQLSPVGCDGATYWYRIKLIVTDPDGLSSLFQKDIFPACNGTSQSISLGDIADQLSTAAPFTINPSATSGLPVVIHIVQGPATISGNTISLTGQPGQVLVRAIQSGNNIYAPAIPVERTFQVSRPGGGTGLIANYFDNIDFTDLAFERIDPVIDFDWDTGSPDPSMGNNTFSIRWEGELQAFYEETYTLTVTADDGVRLWVDDQLLIDEWVDQAPTSYSANLPLMANTRVPIKMEFYENAGGAVAQLEWSSPSQALEVIPQNALFPLTIDEQAPAVTLSTVSNQVNAEFWVTANFSEVITGLDLADFSVSNAVLSDLSGTGLTYTFLVSPDDAGAVSLLLPAAQVSDAAGNGNLVSNTLLVEYDPNSTPCNGPVNLALDQSAVLSSPYSGSGATADLAVDGSTDGNWWAAFSVASSGWGNESWWEVDLGQSSAIEDINIWNRTDCCADFLSDYFVLVSDVPFVSESLTEVLNQLGVSSYEQMTNAGTPTSIPVDRSGRYVRIQKNGVGFMALAEVEVMGCGGSGGDQTPPTVLLSTSNNEVDGPFELAIAFSEPVNDFTLSDLVLTNGLASNLSGSEANYSCTISPEEEGPMTILLPEGSVTDLAGNGNTLSNTLNINYVLPPNCDNLTDAGEITGDQSQCDPYNPTIIENAMHATGGSGDRIYQWQSSTASPAGPWTNLTATGTSYTPGLVTQTTWFRRGARRAGCTEILYTTAVVKTVEDCSGPSNYCMAQGQAPWIEWIEQVNFGAIENLSAKDLYGDYTNLSTEINRGATYPIELIHRFSWDTFDEHWRIWIDWNQDGDFTDDGETVVSIISEAPPLGNTLITTTAEISVPLDAELGTTRMRIAMQRAAYASPCGTFLNGEVEDYSVEVLGTGAPQDQTITFPALGPKSVSTPPFLIQATASSNLPVTFSVLSGPATLVNNELTLTGGTGMVVIEANQAGNALYHPASSVSRSFEVVELSEAPQVLITQPLEAASIEGSTVEINYTLSGDLTLFGADHLLLTLDGQTPIDIHNLNGVYILNNVASGTHDLVLSLTDENHQPLTHPEARAQVNFNTFGG